MSQPPPEPSPLIPASPAAACWSCGAPLAGRGRRCPACGAAPAPPEPLEIVISPSRRLTLDPERIDLRDLVTLVEESVAYWRRRLDADDQHTRQSAAGEIAALSALLDHLARRLSHGRSLISLAPSAPALRRFDRGCARCGRGNRAAARFCQYCGGGLPDVAGTTRPTEPHVGLAGRTDIGRARAANEDTILLGAVESCPLAIVADGMGGHRAGATASRLSVDGIRQHLAPASGDPGWPERLRRAVMATNQQVYRAARAADQQRGMGSTCVVAVFAERQVHLASVGDSRAYLVNRRGAGDDGAAIVQLTVDHTLVARLVDIGQLSADQARHSPQRNIVYRALGTDATVEVDVRSVDVGPGDRIVLCSDGLSGMLDDAEIAEIVLGAGSADQACEQLIGRANARGGDDNISVIVARIDA
ncbi:MAG: Stp1/IreP family PP2C-type Ser/Thr phosphatase [Chloroflexi bacterium]|nr:Stp1/IreP family PP2C-type Ser/Thr phosphatase [Chloroflexota bacterium]